MTPRSYRTYQAFILAGLGIFLLSKVIDGQILRYINQRFVILVLLAALGFLALAQLVFKQRLLENDERLPQENQGKSKEKRYSGLTFWFVILPLIVGVFAPNRALSTSALETRGINTSSQLSINKGTSDEFQIPSTQRSVLDWIRVSNDPSGGENLEGQLADVTGFVYHDLRLESNQFMVGRFTISCCVADAAALGMIVTWADAAALPDNRWVRVQGPITMKVFDDRIVPTINAQTIEEIPEPVQPYLFP